MGKQAREAKAIAKKEIKKEEKKLKQKQKAMPTSKFDTSNPLVKRQWKIVRVGSVLTATLSSNLANASNVAGVNVTSSGKADQVKLSGVAAKAENLLQQQNARAHRQAARIASAANHQLQVEAANLDR